MSDQPGQEGWSVSARLPLIAMTGVLMLLTVALLVAASVYDRRLAKQVRPPAIVMPAPRLELTQTPPGLDRQDTRQPPPAGLARAMRDTAAEGDRLWAGGRP